MEKKRNNSWIFDYSSKQKKTSKLASWQQNKKKIAITFFFFSPSFQFTASLTQYCVLDEFFFCFENECFCRDKSHRIVIMLRDSLSSLFTHASIAIPSIFFTRIEFLANYLDDLIFIFLKNNIFFVSLKKNGTDSVEINNLLTNHTCEISQLISN